MASRTTTRPQRTLRWGTEVFSAVRPVMGPHLGAVRLSGALAVAETLTALLEPWALKLTLDNGIDGRPLPSFLSPLADLSQQQLIVFAGLVSVVVVAMNQVLSYQVVLRSETTAERIGRDARAVLFDRMARAPLGFHDVHRSGELGSRLITDVDRVLDALIAWYTKLGPQLLMLVGMTVVLFRIDTTLATICLLGAAPLWALTARRRRQVRDAEQAAREAKGAFATTVADFVRNIRTVKAFGRAGFVDDTFHRRSSAATERNIASYRVQAQWTPVTDLVLATGSAVVLVVAADRVIDRNLSVGTMLVVLTYVGMLYGPIRSLSGLAATMAKAGVSSARLAELSAQGDVPEPAAPHHLDPSRPTALAVDNVAFTYPNGRQVLDGFSLRVEPGETVALIGPSGAGKSTVCSLVLRLYTPDRGHIRLGGVDIAQVPEADLRRVIGYVPQGAWMLDGSIAENIALGRADLTDQRVRDAGRACLVDDFALTLAQGYDTQAGENGVQLSGGERQRVALARAVAGGAPVLLLDEPTTGLDGDARARVIDAITRAGTGRSVLIVTHDLDLALRADRIVDITVGDQPKRRRETKPPARTTKEVNPHES